MPAISNTATMAGEPAVNDLLIRKVAWRLAPGA